MGSGRWQSFGLGRVIAVITLIFLLLWRFTNILHLGSNPVAWFLIALAVAIALI